MSGEVSESATSYRLPSEEALRAAAKIAMVDDKPIMLDYWTLSLDGKIIIGVKENGIITAFEIDDLGINTFDVISPSLPMSSKRAVSIS